MEVPFASKRFLPLVVLEDFNGSKGENHAGLLLCEDLHTGNLCVEKKLLEEDIRDGFAQMEMYILKQLRWHPNITDLIEAEFLLSVTTLKNGKTVLPSATVWTEYCDLKTLDNFNQAIASTNYRVTEEFMWHLLESLAEAIRYCQHGPVGYSGEWNVVYHRDITPSNIFLTSDPHHKLARVVLGDFGSAITLAHQLSGDSRLLFPKHQNQDFKCPEHPLYTTTSDVYQIGEVLYCLMFGQSVPFFDHTCFDIHNVVGRVMGERYYSHGLRYMVALCLEPDVEERLSVEQLVAGIKMFKGRGIEYETGL